MIVTIRERMLVFLLSSIFATHARANYLLFDAATDSVQIDCQTPYGGSFTYEAIVIFTPAHCGTGAVFTEWTPGHEHRILGVGTNTAFGYNAPRGSGAFTVTGLALSLYQPYHIAYVSERYEERMYLDGQLVGSRATGTSVVDSGMRDLTGTRGAPSMCARERRFTSSHTGAMCSAPTIPIMTGLQEHTR